MKLSPSAFKLYNNKCASTIWLLIFLQKPKKFSRKYEDKALKYEEKLIKD